MTEGGREVVNPATGERVRFLRTAEETGGELLEMEDTWPSATHTVAEHVHPAMEERWNVLEGKVAFRIGGRERVLGPGEAITAGPGVPHSSRNVGGGPVRLRIEMRPGLRWEEFVRRLFAIADDPEAGRLVVGVLEEFSEEIAVPESSH